MKTITILKVIALLSSLGLVACGGGGGGTPASSTTTSGTTTTTTTPPSVKSFTPANNSTGVLTNAKLSVTFNVDMDQTTITDSAFTLSGASTVKGQIAYNIATRTATFTPDAPLKPGTNYTANLTTSITDATGNALTTVFQGQFTTETFIRRVSVDSKGTEATNSSFAPNTSADGRYVVFRSDATDLIGTTDTNNLTDIFVHDTQTGNTTRVSVSTAGIQGDGNSSEPAISADGRYVVFQSLATNLIDGTTDTNNRRDVFVHDMQNNTTELVSVENGKKTPANFSSYSPSISDDGHFIAFTSNATNLVAVGTDTNATTDVFVRDTQQNKTFLVSVDSNEVQGNNQSGGENEYAPHISGNGLYVVFQSRASNLVANDKAGNTDIFVRDIPAGNTKRVSISSGDVEGDRDSLSASISADGHYVAFMSLATNLLAGNDTNNRPDIFVRDTQTGTTTRVSISNSGNEANDASTAPAISADGRYVAFMSDASDLIGVGADTNGWGDVFVRDTQANTTIRVNVNNNSVVGTGTGFGSSFAATIGISADGRYVVFSSNATNLALGGDTNNSYDVFRVLNAKP